MTPDQEAELTRRQLLIRGAGLAGAAGAASILGPTGVARAATVLAPTVLPPPDQSGIEHIVVVMMENRSFDHFLGWLPGADGKQAGLTFVDQHGGRAPHVPPDRVPGLRLPRPRPLLRGRPDPAQRRRAATAGCGPARTTRSPSATTRQSDLPFYGQAAPDWTTCDRYFAAIMAETYPNRFYQHAAQTDRLHNIARPICDAADDLGPARRRRASPARYYFSDVPFTALWGTKYLSIAAAVRRSSSPTARPGTLPGGLVRRPAVPRRGHRARRPTTTRTPTSAPASRS